MIDVADSSSTDDDISGSISLEDDDNEQAIIADDISGVDKRWRDWWIVDDLLELILGDKTVVCKYEHGDELVWNICLTNTLWLCIYVCVCVCLCMCL